MARKLKFVEITTDTRTQYGEFFDGEIRKVTPEVAGFLEGNSWAKPHTVELKVDNATLGVNSEKVDG
jgi:hypothetical protein